MLVYQRETWKSFLFLVSVCSSPHFFCQPLSPFFPPPHLPVLTSASQPYPALCFLLSKLRRHGEEKVLAPALRCSSVSQCTKIMWVLPPMYHRFSPNLWAVGLPNFGYRLGSEGKSHLMLSSPATTQNSSVNSAANICSWEGKRKLMLSCDFYSSFKVHIGNAKPLCSTEKWEERTCAPAQTS